MAGNHVEILRHLHVMNGKMQGQIAEGLGLPAVESQKRYGENLEPPSRLQCPQNVGGIPTAGKNEQQIPRTRQNLQLLCKDIFVPGIVSKAGHHGRVGGKGMHPEGALASAVGPVNQVRCQMIGIGGAPPVPSEKKSRLSLACRDKLPADFRPNRILYQEIQSLIQKIAILFEVLISLYNRCN